MYEYDFDLVLAISGENHDELLNTFDNVNQHIEFIVERKTNNSVPFLVTLLIRNNDNKIYI